MSELPCDAGSLHPHVDVFCSCSLGEVLQGSISDVIQPALGLDRPELDHELQKLQLCVKNVHITRCWFSHDFSVTLQECVDAMENVVELCRVMQRLLSDPALVPDFEACIAQLQLCLAAVDGVQSEVIDRGAASFGLRMEHVATIVLLRSFERLCAAAEDKTTKLYHADSAGYNKDTLCMSYTDVTVVIDDMKKAHAKMNSAMTPFCRFVEIGRKMLFHGTEPGTALAFVFCAGSVCRVMDSLGSSAKAAASRTADELMSVMSLLHVCDEESIMRSIAESQAKLPPHPVCGDLTWMHALLSKAAEFQLHCSMSKFESKPLLDLFVNEFSHVRKAGRLIMPSPDSPDNKVKRCSVLTASILQASPCPPCRCIPASKHAASLSPMSRPGW